MLIEVVGGLVVGMIEVRLSALSTGLGCWGFWPPGFKGLGVGLLDEECTDVTDADKGGRAGGCHFMNHLCVCAGTKPFQVCFGDGAGLRMRGLKEAAVGTEGGRDTLCDMDIDIDRQCKVNSVNGFLVCETFISDQHAPSFL